MMHRSDVIDNMESKSQQYAISYCKTEKLSSVRLVSNSSNLQKVHRSPTTMVATEYAKPNLKHSKTQFSSGGQLIKLYLHIIIGEGQGMEKVKQNLLAVFRGMIQQNTTPCPEV